ncbi:MAG: flagellar motor protein MotB [Pseudomonadota bacterium]
MTADDAYPEPIANRPIWLMTLADLGLLLVGFFVFIQASQHLDGKQLAQGIRSGFGAPPSAVPVTSSEPMPVAAAAMLDFAPGSATLPSSPAGLIAWAREVTRDPRIVLKVSGGIDGSPSDVDATTGSGAVLAADRARAVAAALAEAHAVPPGRLEILGAGKPGHRNVTVTIGFAGNLQTIAARQPDIAAP